MFGGSAPLSASLDAAASAGWPMVGLDIATLGFGTPGGVMSQEDTAAELDRRGLGCSEVTAIAIAADETAVSAQIDAVLHVARAVGAPIAVCVFGAGTTAVDPDHRTGRRIASSVCKRLSDEGVVAAFEFRTGSPLSSLDQTRALCDAIGLDTAKICLDAWHVFATGGLDQLSSLSREEIGIVQLCDGDSEAIAGATPLDSIMKRELPGDGSFDLDGFVIAIVRTGYNGIVSAEVFSEMVRDAPPSALATRLYDRVVQLIGPVGGPPAAGC